MCCALELWYNMDRGSDWFKDAYILQKSTILSIHFSLLCHY